MEGLMLPVPAQQANKLAELFQSPGELCIKLEIKEDETRSTTYSARGMNYYEVWVICEEIALSCRLKKMTNGAWKDDREEFDTLGLDRDAKVCVTYLHGRQDFSWMRKNLTYQDAEIALMTVSEMMKRLLYPEGSIK